MNVGDHVTITFSGTVRRVLKEDRAIIVTDRGGYLLAYDPSYQHLEVDATGGVEKTPEPAQ